MNFYDQFIACYGWEGAALAVVLLLLTGVQLYYYLLLYGKIASYKNNDRKVQLESEPAISVVVALFSEDYNFVEERLPLIMAQSYSHFEIVLVYVGQDSDFYEDLTRLRLTFPQVTTSKVLFDPHHPISRKMALNIGIKSAHYDHILFTTTDCCPQTNRWLSLMGKGFMRGDIVLGYCGMEEMPGLQNYLMRTWRMMHSTAWLVQAIRRRPYRGLLQNLGFTKELYFKIKGFGNLNMNIGEDDLFLQRIATAENVSVILSPRATLRERCWGGLGWFLGQQRYFGSAERFYPAAARAFTEWEVGSRALFFAAAICAFVVMPPEFKLAVAALMLIRYTLVLIGVRRIAKRLGEEGILARYLIYDLFSPLWSALLTLVQLRKDERVWR